MEQAKKSLTKQSEEVKIRIKQLYRLGRDISYSAVLAEHPHLLFAVVHYFRNWGHAVTACGIDYKKVRQWPKRTCSKNKIIRKIKTLKNKAVDLSFRAMFRQGFGAVVSMRAFYLGSWRRAIEQAGLDYDKIKKGSS